MNARRDPLIRRLIEKLASGDPIARRNAAGALRLHGSRARCAMPALTRLLDDEDAAVRQEVERALACLGSEVIAGAGSETTGRDQTASRRSASSSGIGRMPAA